MGPGLSSSDWGGCFHLVNCIVLVLKFHLFFLAVCLGEEQSRWMELVED